MGCPFVDKRYGQNYCDAMDEYVEWDNYCNTCESCDYGACERYKKEYSKREVIYYTVPNKHN